MDAATLKMLAYIAFGATVIVAALAFAMRKKKDSRNILTTFAVLFLVAGVLSFAMGGGFAGLTAAPVEPGGVEPDVSQNHAVGYATTIMAGAVNQITSGTNDINAEIRSTDTSNYALAETQMNDRPESLSTAAPNTLSGYLMAGNDNAESTTDRGGEVYYRKIPFSYVGMGTYNIVDKDANGVPTGSQFIRTFEESDITWTGKDDGTTESDTNITVGASATVRLLSIKIASDNNGSIGNPDLSNPVAVCFNASNKALWDEIKPANYVATVPACDAFTSENIVGGNCYVLPTAAVKNYGTYTFDVILDAATGANPTTTDWLNVFLLDKTYYKNDVLAWVDGFCDNSDQGTDVDPGIDGRADVKTVYFN